MLSPAAMRASKAATSCGSSVGAVRVFVMAVCSRLARERTIDGSGAPVYLACMLTRPAVTGTAIAGGDVSLTIADGVGTIRFSHPKRNSLPGALLRRLAEAINWMGRDPA